MSSAFLSAIETFAQKARVKLPFDNSVFMDTSNVRFFWEKTNDTHYSILSTTKTGSTNARIDTVYGADTTFSFFRKNESYTSIVSQFDTNNISLFVSDTIHYSFLSPINFSNCLIWLIADSVNEIDTLGAIGELKNLSDSSITISQNSASKQPTLIHTSDGLPAVEFDGIDDFLNVSALNSSNSNYTLLGVYETYSSTTSYLLDVQSGRLSLAVESPNGAYVDIQWEGSSINSVQPNFITFKLDSLNKSTIWLNWSVIQSNVNYVPRKLGGISSIGSKYGGGILNFDGNISELIFFKEALSDSLTDLFHNYFETKYSRKLLFDHDIQIDYGFCPSDLFIDSTSIESVLWSTGDTSFSILNQDTGKYWVSALNRFGVTVSDTIYIYSERPLLNVIRDTTLCLGDSLIWNTNFPDSYEFSWSNQDSASAIVVKEPGKYWVKVTDSLGCFFTSDTVKIEYDSLKTNFSLGKDLNLCEGNVFEVPNYMNYISINWNTGDSGSSITIDSSKTLIATVINSFGCSGTDSIYINIKGSAPHIKTLYSNVCFGDTTHFVDSSYTSIGGINSWKWKFSAFDSILVKNASYLFPDTGNQVFLLTVATDSGCLNTITDTLRVYPPPTIKMISPTLICSSDSVVFTDSSSSKDGIINSVNWFAETSRRKIDTISNNTFSIAYDSIGFYEIKSKVSTTLGCDASDSTIIQVYSTPNISYSLSGECEKDTVEIKELNSGLGQFDYSVYIDSVFYKTGTIMSVFDTGYHSIEIAKTDTTGCFNILNDNFYINQKPKINVSVLYSICQNDTIEIGSSFDTTNYLINWISGENDSSIFVNSPRVSSFTVLDSNNCLSHSDTIKIVYDSYVTSTTLGNDTSLCGYSTISLKTNKSITSRYTWSTGDTSSSIVIDSSKSIILEAKNAHNCAAIDTINVIISGYNPFSNFNFTGLCYQDLTAFSNTSSYSSGDTILNRLWDFGDGTTSVNKNPNHSYSASGSYTVTLTNFAASGCQSKLKQNVTILTNPSANFSTSIPCTGYPVNFTDKSTGNKTGIKKWNWNFNDPWVPLLFNFDSIQNPTHTYDSLGFYNVELIVTDSNDCSGSTFIQINPFQSPKANFSIDSTCIGSTSSISDKSISTTTITRHWDLGDGFSSTGKSVNHDYDSVGKYIVHLEVKDFNQCFDTLSRNIQVFNLPKVSGMQLNHCLGDSLVLYSTSTTGNFPLNKYWWRESKRVLSEKPEVTIAAFDIGNHQIELAIEDSFGCKDSALIDYIVYPKPRISFNLAFEPDSAPYLLDIINQSIDSDTNRWYLNDSLIAEQLNPNYVINQNGDYQISFQAMSNMNCKSDTSFFLDISPKILDIGVISFAYENTSNNLLKLTCLLQNFGTKSINNFTLNILDENRLLLSEEFKGELGVGKKMIYEFKSQIFSSNAPKVLCLEIQDPNGRIDHISENNLKCLTKDVFEFFQITPNPSKGIFSLSISLEERSYVFLQIFDINGNTLYDYPIGILDKGFNSLEVTNLSLLPGKYLLKINDVVGNSKVQEVYIIK